MVKGESFFLKIEVFPPQSRKSWQKSVLEDFSVFRNGIQTRPWPFWIKQQSKLWTPLASLTSTLSQYLDTLLNSRVGKFGYLDLDSLILMSAILRDSERSIQRIVLVALDIVDD